MMPIIIVAENEHEYLKPPKTSSNTAQNQTIYNI